MARQPQSQIAVRTSKIVVPTDPNDIDFDEIPLVENPGLFLVQSGHLWRYNQSQGHPTGYAMTVDPVTNVIAIYDFRKFPQAAIFDPETYKGGKAKFDTHMKERGHPFLQVRREIFGLTVQLEPDWRVQSKQLKHDR